MRACPSPCKCAVLLMAALVGVSCLGSGPPPPSSVRDTTSAQPKSEASHCFWSSFERNGESAERLAQRLASIDDAPYICSDLCAGGPGCGDVEFWRVVRRGTESLVALLDDGAATAVSIPNYDGRYAVGDVALLALAEVVHGIPIRTSSPATRWPATTVGVTVEARCSPSRPT